MKVFEITENFADGKDNIPYQDLIAQAINDKKMTFINPNTGEEQSVMNPKHVGNHQKELEFKYLYDYPMTKQERLEIRPWVNITGDKNLMRLPVTQMTMQQAVDWDMLGHPDMPQATIDAARKRYPNDERVKNPTTYKLKSESVTETIRKKTNETSEEEYKNLINQYFRKGSGFELGGGATYKMMWHELKAARRWLAQAVKAGEIEPGVDIAQDLTIRDKNGLEIGQPGHLTIKAAAALDKARNIANAAGKKLSSKQVDNITNKHNTDAEAQRDFSENFADGKKKGKSRPGRVKKAGASCKGSVTSLRKKAAKYSGEKGKMYHWCANMKGGKKK
jgi:hypothetical protein